jgi:hypothetical protein
MVKQVDEVDGAFVHPLGFIFTVVGDVALVTAWGHTTALTRAEAREWWSVANETARYWKLTGVQVNLTSADHIGRY